VTPLASHPPLALQNGVFVARIDARQRRRG
jgi:hypothetical protein